MPASPTPRRDLRHRTALGAVSLTAALLAAPCAVAVAEPGAQIATDTKGYVGTAAYCQGSATAVAFGRTDEALVAICSGPDGQLQYRGVRLADDSALMLAADADDEGGFVATNGAVRYHVSSAELIVTEGDTTLHRQSMVQYYRAPAAAS